MRRAKATTQPMRAEWKEAPVAAKLVLLLMGWGVVGGLAGLLLTMACASISASRSGGAQVESRTGVKLRATAALWVRRRSGHCSGLCEFCRVTKDWAAGFDKVGIKGGKVVDVGAGKVKVVVDDTELALFSDLEGEFGGSVGKDDVLEVALEGLLEVDFCSGQLGVDLLFSQGVQSSIKAWIETETKDMVVTKSRLTIGNDRVVEEHGTWDEEGHLQLPLDGFEHGGSAIHINALKDGCHMPRLDTTMMSHIADHLHTLSLVFIMRMIHEGGGGCFWAGQ